MCYFTAHEHSFQKSCVFLSGIRWKFTFVAPFCRKVCYTGFSAATDGADPETPLRAMDVARILRPCMPQNPAFSRFPAVFCHHEGGLVVPALITHYQFAQRVFSRLRQAGAPVADRDAGLIGAQGPDLFFFHRILPWEPGKSYVREGVRMHKLSPARIFEGFRAVLNRTEEPERSLMQSYVEGCFCHYALDRAAHPYVRGWQEVLAEEQPAYAKSAHTYHFRIESALDTIILRRETGRLVQDFKLTAVLPPEREAVHLAIGRLYARRFAAWFGTADADPAHIGQAPADMRRVLRLMTDRSGLRRRWILRPVEAVSGRAHFASALLRPADTSDWDYANEAHRPWHNPDDPALTSTDSFFDLYELAAAEAEDMITAFRAALPTGQPMIEITQDRGFSSDLPARYDG